MGKFSSIIETYDGEGIGHKLRELRLESGKEVHTVASELHIDENKLKYWERNRSRPPRNIIPVLAKYYGIDAAELFDLTRVLPKNRKY